MMEIKKIGETYQVESSKPGVYYEIDLKKNTCTCPHYIHRVRRTGGDCKHIKAVKESLSGCAEEYDKIIGYIKENVFVDTAELIERFGLDNVDSLLSNGELIEESGKICLL